MTAEILDITLWGYSLPHQNTKISSWGWMSGESPPGGGGTPGGAYISNHTELALDLFIEQFEDKPVIEGNETAFLTPYQPLEDLLQDMKREMLNIIDGTGDRLDTIGEIVGLERNGRNDTDYKVALQIQIILNNSNGEPEVVRKAVLFLTGATSVKLTEGFPAGLDFVINTIFPIPSNLQTEIEKIASSGVRIGLYLSDDEDDFAFDGEGGYPPEPNTLGFGETGIGNELEGGKFVELI